MPKLFLIVACFSIFITLAFLKGVEANRSQRLLTECQVNLMASRSAVQDMQKLLGPKP